MTTVERPIPDYLGYFANAFGGIRGPGGYLQQHETKDGHQFVMLNNSVRYVHRLVAFAFGIHNPRPDLRMEVDHINRNPYDNRPCNLRFLTHQLNTMNNDGLCVRFVKTGYSWQRNKWAARIRVQGKVHRLGYHKTFQEAYQKVKAFRAAAFKQIYDELVNAAPAPRPDLLRAEREDVPSAA